MVRVERGPSTHLISVGFGLSLGERTHILLAGRAEVITEDLVYILAVARVPIPGVFLAPGGLGLHKIT